LFDVENAHNFPEYVSLGHQTSVKKVNVKSTETENGWIDKKGFEKQNSGGAPGPQLSQSESH